MKAWGLTDGSAGMMAQVRALADSLGVELEEKTVSVKQAWLRFPNKFFDWGLAGFFPVTQEVFVAVPELVISCGRKAALVAANMRTDHPHTKYVHIQDPQMSPKHFDAVVAMAHDKIKGANVIKVPFALHNITAEKLAAARAECMTKFGHLRHPWNTVLIGGSTNKYKFSERAMEKLIAEIEQIPGSLLITTSRRTGEKNIEALAARLQNNGRVYLYTGKGENPYLGMLACADHVYVTNDSVNMMSEALASGRPVSVLKLQGHKRTKPARFAEKLHAQNISPQVMMKELAARVREMLGGSA